MWAIAHRGASGYAPENTRAAFELAIELGADAIETDVRVTTDGALVLFHDDTVDRTTDASGPVEDFSLAELRSLDLGSWFGPAYRGEGIVMLDELLDSYASRIPIVLEIKDPRATASIVERVVERTLLERVQVTSFFWYPLLEARTLSPEVSLGFLTLTFAPELVERVRRRGFNQLCPRVDQLTVGGVAHAHERGLGVRAWGVRHRFEVERLVETGADGATVDCPDWLVGVAG